MRNSFDKGSLYTQLQHTHHQPRQSGLGKAFLGVGAVLIILAVAAYAIGAI